MEVKYTEDLIIYEKTKHAVIEGDHLTTEHRQFKREIGPLI
jgi:hypothetical protein